MQMWRAHKLGQTDCQYQLWTKGTDLSSKRLFVQEKGWLDDYAPGVQGQSHRVPEMAVVEDAEYGKTICSQDARAGQRQPVLLCADRQAHVRED